MGNRNFKQHKKNGYTVVDNSIMMNKNISLRAKGLLIVMLSLPPDWNFTETGLVSIGIEGRDAIRSTLQELEKHKYLKRTRERGDNGRLKKIFYDIYEEPYE